MAKISLEDKLKKADADIEKIKKELIKAQEAKKNIAEKIAEKRRQRWDKWLDEFLKTLDKAKLTEDEEKAILEKAQGLAQWCLAEIRAIPSEPTDDWEEAKIENFSEEPADEQASQRASTYAE